MSRSTTLEAPVDIRPSAEIRWFLPGAAPALTAWFNKALPGADPEELRTDEYLCFPAADFAGVKLRRYLDKNPPQLNLEFKLREQALGLASFGDTVSGHVERWRKWSVTLGQDAKSYAEQVCGPQGRRWCTVRKVRRLQKFRIAKNGCVTPAKVEERLAQGCGVELTDITAGFDPHRANLTWTSFGCEAFSADASADLTAILGQTLRHVLAAAPPPALLPADSCGYPQWMNRLLLK